MELGQITGKTEKGLLAEWQQIFKKNLESQAKGQQNINHHTCLSNESIIKKISCLVRMNLYTDFRNKELVCHFLLP